VADRQASTARSLLYDPAALAKHAASGPKLARLAAALLRAGRDGGGRR
jgi:hypothetical protein